MIYILFLNDLALNRSDYIGVFSTEANAKHYIHQFNPATWDNYYIVKQYIDELIGAEYHD